MGQIRKAYFFPGCIYTFLIRKNKVLPFLHKSGTNRRVFFYSVNFFKTGERIH